MANMLTEWDHVNWDVITHQELDLLLCIDREHMNKPLRHMGSRTPLGMACKLNREDLVTILLAHGAKTDLEGAYKGLQSLHHASEFKKGNLGMMRKLLDAGANVDAQESFGYTALHIACRRRNLPVVELLCQYGANVNLVCVDDTALALACMHERVDIINVLLSHGADPNACEGKALKNAISQKSHSVTKILINAGLAVEKWGNLTMACRENSIKLMKVLLSHGVSVNKPTKYGISPLQEACCDTADLKSVHFLLKRGANVNPVASGSSPLSVAATRMNVAKVRLLLAFGADAHVVEGVHLFFAIIERILRGYYNKKVPALTKESVLVYRLLLACGMKLTANDVDKLREKLTYAEENRPRAVLEDVIEDYSKGPMSLQALCRISLRGCIHPNVDCNVKTLEIPRNLQQYLNFDDIVDESCYEPPKPVRRLSETDIFLQKCLSEVGELKCTPSRVWGDKLPGVW